MTEIGPFRRSFPWEILALVFEFSDDSTLAALGGVSLDALETVASLLYRTVRITSVEQLELLFCKRDEATKPDTPSRINHLLDFSQVHNLDLDFTSISSAPSSRLKLFLSRKSSPTETVPLDSLRVSLKFEHASFLRMLHSHLFPHLNPIVFEYNIEDRSPLAEFLAFDLHRVPTLRGFTRLQILDLKGLLPFLHLGNRHPAALPVPSLEVRRVVRLHVGTLLSLGNPSVASFVAKLPNNWGMMLSLVTMQDGAVVLVVRGEEERKQVEEGLRQVEERWRSKFVLEVEV